MSVTNPDKVVTKQDLADFYQELLPYLGGVLPFSGQINRSDIYSTTEKVVGCWTSGKPIYQKTISFGALPNNTSKTVNHSISNAERFIDIRGYASNGTALSIPITGFDKNNNTTNTLKIRVNGTSIFIVTSVDMSSFTECYITLSYTKTTDAANSFVYASENDYSASEKIIGTWIDEKKLYQRTYSSSVSNLTTAGTVTVASLPSGIDKIIEIGGIVTNDDSDSTWRALNFYNSATEYANLRVNQTKTSIRADMCNPINGATTLCFYVTIKYTKKS